MAHIVLFHSAQGLRPAIRDWAARLRRLGHTVDTPDLFDGRTFEQLEDGVRYRDALGIPELARRASTAVEALTEPAVFMGFSMGAASAQFLASSHPQARAAVLMHGALPPAALGKEHWPAGVPAQVHTAEQDPWVDFQAVEALARDGVEVFKYPGAAHLFADPQSGDYEAGAASTMFERISNFVAQLELGGGPA